ncbi:MAG TPA: universal stress protein [Ktedonobacteraceae bacterium]|jgi:nucleotide-binding universal stress UspA family protein
MFTRILVPLDGSAQAERALPVAARLACALDGTLILARVAQPLGLETSLLAEHPDTIQSYLTHVAQQPGLAEVKHEEAALVGSPAEMLLSTIHTHQADSMILCSHGRTGLRRWALGSVAHHVIHHASVPVLVLPQQGLQLQSVQEHPLHALVPLDGSHLSEAALEPAGVLVSALAPQGQGIIHLVEVVPFPSVPPEADATTSPEARARDATIQEAHAYLQRTAAHLRREPFVHPSVQITCHVLGDTDVAGALVDFAQSAATAQAAGGPGHVDVLAMATHGRGGLQRWVMGSVTERVLTVSKLPLLVIRPKAEGVIK